MSTSYTRVSAVQVSLNREDQASTLQLQTEEVKRDLEPGEVLVKLLFAPIHPSNINIMEGRYLYKPELPYVGGTEGSGEVIAIADKDSRFAVGDLVIVVGSVKDTSEYGGSYSTHLYRHESCLIKCSKGADPKQAAIAHINPVTALGLLDPRWSGVELKEGDWIVQNAANSAVGQCVIQVAKAYGFKTLNLVRRKELIDELKDLGADEVILDDNASIKKYQGSCKLSLNAVGGDSAKRVSKCMRANGVMLTYGAMSKQPVVVSNSALIFFNMTYKGFHVGKWLDLIGKDKFMEACKEVLDLVCKGKLVQSIDSVYPLKEIQDAVKRALQPKRNGKVLVSLSE